MTHTPSSPSLFPAGALKPQLSDSPGTNCSISRAGAWPPPSAAHTDPAGATQLWRAARAPANYALLCWEAALPGTVPHGCSPAGPHCPDLVPATRSLTAGWGGAALRSWGGPQIAPMTPTARHGAAPRCRPRGCVQSELQWVRWGPESPTLPWSGGPCSWQPPAAGSPPPAALVNVKASGRHCAQPCLPAASLPAAPLLGAACCSAPLPKVGSAQPSWLKKAARWPEWKRKAPQPAQPGPGHAAGRPWGTVPLCQGQSGQSSAESSSAASRSVRCPHHVMDRSRLCRESSVPSEG